jgi:hypothetical protein
VRSEVLAVALLALAQMGCSWRAVPNSQNWVVESYSYGVITARHDGREYTATCDFGASFAPKGETGSNIMQYFPKKCETALGLVQREVQPYGGQRRDENGRILNMWTTGDTLALRSWENDSSPWQQEHFKVTSITASLH